MDLTVRQIGRRFAKVMETATLTGYTRKDLRDTFGSWLLSCGVPIARIKEQLGHSSIATTETHYTELIKGVRTLYLREGEVFADFPARLEYETDCHQSCHHGEKQ